MKRRNVATMAGIGAATVALALGGAFVLDRDGNTAGAAELVSYVATTSAADGTGLRDQVQELMTDDEFRADLDVLRDTQHEAMDAWWEKYGEDPSSEAAREAMQALREDAGSAMQELAAEYGVQLPEGSGGFLGKHGGGMGGGHKGGGMMGPGGGFGGGGTAPTDSGTTPESEETTQAALSI